MDRRPPMMPTRAMRCARRGCATAPLTETSRSAPRVLRAKTRRAMRCAPWGYATAPPIKTSRSAPRVLRANCRANPRRRRRRLRTTLARRSPTTSHGAPRPSAALAQSVSASGRAGRTHRSAWARTCSSFAMGRADAARGTIPQPAQQAPSVSASRRPREQTHWFGTPPQCRRRPCPRMLR